MSRAVIHCRQFDRVVGALNMSNEPKEESPSVYSVDSTANLVTIKSRNTYFKRKCKKTGFLLHILSLAVAVLLAGVITLGILYVRISKSSHTLCDSEECVRISASLKESMDTSIDPCKDFYKYACGRWSQHHPTPDTNMMNSWFSERSEKVTWRIRELLRKNLTDAPWAVSQAQILYTSCVNLQSMDELGLSPLLKFLKDLDLPQVPAALSQKAGNFVQKMARVRKILGKDVFIGLNVIPDPRNRSRNVIILDRPSAVSPLPGDKEIEKRLKTLRRKIANSNARSTDESSEPESFSSIEKSYIAAVINQVVNNDTVSTCKSKNHISSKLEDEISRVANKIYELSGIFYFMARADENETISEENLNDADYMNIDNLQMITDAYVRNENSSLAPKKIWRPFIEEIFRGLVEGDLDIGNRVLVANMGYIKNLALLFTQTDEETLETTIWWIAVDVVAPHLSNNLRKIWSDYIDKLVSVEDYDPRSLHCAEVVNYMMGMAVSWLFVDPKFHNGTGIEVVEMLEHIRASFSSLVATTTWMDKITKISTLEKSNKMAYVIGHPDWLFDADILNEYYKGTDMKEDLYLENMLMIAKLMSQAELELIGQVNFMNSTYWAAEPTDVNAVYTVIVNHITVPAGILQFPFYKLGLEALNYGAIGTILGHELTHGFDNSGRLYDGDGNLRQWWSNQTILEYKEKVECFIEHYSGYYEAEVNEHIDGLLTLDENIADNGGLREAVLAYKKWRSKHGQEPFLPGFTHLTHEQLLFLGFAHLWCEAYTPESLRWMLQDSHSPGHVRLRAVLKNSREFSEAWQCPVGSPMNPHKKCRIW